MLNVGPPELILIFVIALVVVGPQRLPELGRMIGKGMRELRKMQDEVRDLVNTGMGEDFKQTAAELKKTATELKSATDVRSAFHDDRAHPRTRPRSAPAPDAPSGPTGHDDGPAPTAEPEPPPTAPSEDAVEDPTT